MDKTVTVDMETAPESIKSTVRAIEQQDHMTVSPGYALVDGEQKRGYHVTHDKISDPAFPKIDARHRGQESSTGHDKAIPTYFVVEGPAGGGIGLISCDCGHHQYRLQDGEECKHMARVKSVIY